MHHYFKSEDEVPEKIDGNKVYLFWDGPGYYLEEREDYQIEWIVNLVPIGESIKKVQKEINQLEKSLVRYRQLLSYYENLQSKDSTQIGKMS